MIALLLTAMALVPVDPAPPPTPSVQDCRDLARGAPECKAPDGMWQTCPLPVLRARKCELRLLREHEADLKLDLAAALEERDKLHAGWTKANDLLEAQRVTLDAKADHYRGVAVWGYVLGFGGAGAALTGVYLGTHHDVVTGAVIGGVGALALAFGLGLVL